MNMIGQLTGGVEHDFNNLLMAVIANLDLLKRHVAGDPRMARLIDGAIQGANRGASLIQRLFACARWQDLALAPKDISDLVSGLGDLLTNSVGRTSNSDTTRKLILLPRSSRVRKGTEMKPAP